MGTRRESGLGLFRKPVGGAMAQEANAVRVRTLFLSDLHLGTKGCQADALLEFLKALRCGHHLSGRRHRRWMEAEIGLVLAAGP